MLVFTIALAAVSATFEMLRAAPPVLQQSPRALPASSLDEPGCEPCCLPGLLNPWSTTLDQSTSARAATQARVPAEFEHQRALLLGCRELAVRSPETFADIVAAARYRIRILALVARPTDHAAAQAPLARRGLDSSAVQFVALPHNSMWVRDYAPLIVERPAQGPILVDSDYSLPSRKQDDAASFALASGLKVPARHLSLRIDGGNLLVNGRGLCVATTRLRDEAALRGIDAAALDALLTEYFGIRETIWLEPLAGEPTGHADMFASFASSGDVVIGQCDKAQDATNAEILDRNARLLAAATVDGRPLRVTRIPMPNRDDGVWRTHTNVLYANGMLLLPVYRQADAASSAAAAETFARLLPGWKIEPIDCEQLARLNGGIHCVTQTLSLDVPYQNLPAPHWMPGESIDRNSTSGPLAERAAP